MMVLNYFLKSGIDKEDLKTLQCFNSRDGFVIIDEFEFEEIIEYFGQYEVYSNLIPVLTDNNSNYWCVYVGGILSGMVCYLDHNELSLEPKFNGVYELINTINQNPDAYDFYELENSVFNFPIREHKTINANKREAIVNALIAEFKLQDHEDVKQQMAYAIMALTSKDELESNIYPFLDSENMYIQERAIQMLGFHKYEPARQKLIQLTKTAMTNGKSAAGKALKELNKK